LTKPKLLFYVVGDRIGDALIKLPVILGLRSAFEKYHIVWVAGRRPSVFAGPLKPLIDGSLDEVHECADLGVGVREFLAPPRLSGLFDIVIDTQQKVLATLLVKRVPHRLFISRAAGFRFSDRKPGAGESAAQSAQGRFLELVNLAVAGRPIKAVKRIELPATYLAAAQTLLPAGPCYIGFAPGAGGAAKRWPLQGYIEAAREQTARGRQAVFFLGPQERHWQNEIARALPGVRFPEWEYRGSLETGPLLTMALARQLSAGVANDAGPGHLLAAAGCTVITLFGRTNPAKFALDGTERIIITAREFGERSVVAIPVGAVCAQINRAVNQDANAPG